jgi:hypothetical protein
MAEENKNYRSDTGERSYKSEKEKMDELITQLDEGVKAVRNSAEFKELMSAMARFPRYSVNNCILIATQKPDATLCQSFGNWKKMGRYVKKGEKGIKIIAPSPYTIQKETEKLDSNGKQIFGPDGEPVKETVEVNKMGFKVENTFDISQTDGKEFPHVGVDELEGRVDKYQVLMDVLAKISPVPIGFEDIASGAKGYYNNAEKRIAIQQGMSELQTLKTCLHECIHAEIHSNPECTYSKNRKELEAEGAASVVLNFLGYDTGEYSFPYLAGYVQDDNMTEFKEALDTIRDVSKRFINNIEEKIRETVPEFNQIKEAQEAKDAVNEAATDEKKSEMIPEQAASEKRALGFVKIIPNGEEKKPSLIEKLKAEKEKLMSGKENKTDISAKGVAI